MAVQGTVKWFDDAKGYGYITADTGEDVFVHHTAIRELGHRKLKDGERVEVEIVVAEKGPKAASVVKLGSMATGRA